MKHLPEITDREMEIMEVVWSRGEVSAQEIAAHYLQKENGAYSKNTTYTFLNRLVAKGVLKRKDPGFLCIPACRREEVQAAKTESFLERVYNGSFRALFSQFAQGGKLTQDDIRELRGILDEAEKQDGGC